MANENELSIGQRRDKPVDKATNWVSWNENVQHPYAYHHTIRTEAELAQRIGASEGRVRVYGSKQSSADIAAGTETLIDMREYNQIVSFDKEKKRVTVQSGITLKKLMVALQDRGWTIPCLPDIDTVTLGGALSTGTHGTGREGKMLPDYMVHCRMILADGNSKEIEAGEELMDAVRVSLGVLGIFSEITLQCEEIYTLHLKEQPMHDDQWLEQFDQLIEDNDFTRVLWMPHTDHGYVILGNRINPETPVKNNPGPGYLKYRRAVSRLLYKYTTKFPFLTTIANKIIYKLFFTSKKESKGTLYDATVTKSRSGTLELAEWTIAKSRFHQVFTELKAALDSRDNAAYVHIPMDIRFIREDDSWLSYAYGEDCVTVGCVTRDAANADHYAAFEVVEEIFLKHGGRPHWGKRFEAKDAELSKIYPKWEAFKSLRKKLDPNGKFLNGYLKTLLATKSVSKLQSKNKNANRAA